MRLAFALIPALLFILAYAEIEGFREVDLARKQAELDHVSAEMNELSANISREIQAVSLGKASYEEVQGKIDQANGHLSTMQKEIQKTWAQINELKLKAAQAKVLGRALKSGGIALAFLAFGIIANREARFAPYCLVAIALILGVAAV